MLSNYQQQNLRQAANRGTLDQFTQNHPGTAANIGQNRMANLQQKNTAAQPAQGNPAAGAGGQKAGGNAPGVAGANATGGRGPGTGGQTTLPQGYGPNVQPTGQNPFGSTATVTQGAGGPAGVTQNRNTPQTPPNTAGSWGGISPVQQSQLMARGVSAEAWQKLSAFPAMQQSLLRQVENGPTTAPAPAGTFDPTHVTHTINGQRVVIGQNGQVQMLNGSPAVSDANGRPTGMVLDSHGTPVAAANAPGMPAPTSYQDLLNTQYGANNPLGMQSFYGGNPLETARDSAQRALDENLAKIRAQYAANGLGNSARAGIAEGTAISDFGTGLADVLATRGQAARDSDANRGLQAILGAGSQNLQGQSLDIQRNQQLANLGQSLNAIGGLEQQIPNVEAILAMLANFSTTFSQGRNKQESKTGSGFLGM